MQADHRCAESERAPARGDGAPDGAGLRATCQRQAWALETMSRVLRDMRAGVTALKAENAELREVSDRRRAVEAARAGAGEWVEARVPLDDRAPGAARIVVAHVLGECVGAPVLERAKLVMSELVEHSVRHRGAGTRSGVIVRVRQVESGIWLEVEDPGCDGMVTRVCAQLSDTASPAAGAREIHRRERGRTFRSGDVHVIPEPRAATWSVYVDAEAGAVSAHTSETEAESAARVHARVRGAKEIVVHDRYHRTHAAAP